MKTVARPPDEIRSSMSHTPLHAAGNASNRVIAPEMRSQAPPVGLEPTTLRLTAERSAN